MSAEYEAERNSKGAVVVWMLHLHFDAFFDLPAKDFYFSTVKGTTELFLNGNVEQFTGKLASTPQGRHQRESRNDYAEFSLGNSHNATYQDFLDYEPLIEKGEVLIMECYEIGRESGYYEGETRFVGYLKDFTVNESDQSLDFTCVSDMSRTGFAVGARILTRERCGTLFNYGGLNSPEYHPCGWQVNMGGNPDFCSHYLKGVDSCVAHGNPHRFYAVPALSVASIYFVQQGEVDFPYNTDGCFAEDTCIVLPDWSIRPIQHHTKGLIKAYDIFTGKILDTKIEEFQKHWVDEVAIAQFETGSLISTRAHLFNESDVRYAPLGGLVGKTVVGLGLDRKDAQNTLTRLHRLFVPQWVYNYSTESSTILVTDSKMSYIWKTHNRKANTPYEY